MNNNEVNVLSQNPPLENFESNSYDTKSKVLFKLSVCQKYRNEFENKNFSQYHKAIYLNSANRNLFRKIISYQIIYYLIVLLLIVSSICELIFYTRLINNHVYLWIGMNAILFFLLYIPWLSKIVFSFNKPKYYQSDRMTFIIKEFLKCRQDCQNHMFLSNERLLEVKKFYTKFYYKYVPDMNGCEKIDYFNKKIRSSKKSLNIDLRIKKIFFALNILLYSSMLLYIFSLVFTFAS